MASYLSCKLLVLAALLCAARAFIYDRCDLARDLKNKYGFPMRQVPTLVCIAYHESRYDTKAIGKPNGDKSVDYGLFQINNRYWCDRGPSLGCGVSCNTLLEDISKVAKCVKTVYDETKRLKGDGFKAWTTYKFCSQPASFIDGCGL